MRPLEPTRWLTALVATTLLGSCSLIVSFDNEPLCGDGVAETDEPCDGEDLRDQDCEDFGLYRGTLSCRGDCTLDLSACGGRCGDGIRQNDGVDTFEQCDGSDLGGTTCQDESSILTQGTPTCTSDCSLSFDTCWGCGDGTLDSGEQCEWSLPITETCEDRGYTGGFLTCDQDCQLDPVSCFNCGDGQCQAYDGETWPQCTADCRWRWEALAVGYRHTCAANFDGRLYCWGDNATGALGWDPQTLPGIHAIPVLATELETHAMAAGDGFTVAEGRSSVLTWGANDRGQLGRTTTEPWIPGDLQGPAGIEELARFSAGRAFACGISPYGVPYCWGDNTYGQLGSGGTPGSPPYATVAGTVAGLTDVAEIAAGDEFACARLGSNEVWCWGRGDSGQLGDGQSTDSADPVQATGLPAGPLQSIAAGRAHVCVVHGSTVLSLWCWGDNSRGQFGASAPASSDAPVSIGSLPGSGTVLLIAGDDHTCRYTQGGPVTCWGDNTYGQAGAPATCGTPSVQATPTAITVSDGTPLDPVRVVVSRGNTGCAENDTGDLWCWGDNAAGQIGTGGGLECYDTAQPPTP